MRWLIAGLFCLGVVHLRADELPPGYLIPATELETVYALQRLGYPVKEIREEIELDVLEATATGPDTLSPKLKKATIAAKPGMFLVRTERPLGFGWSSAFRRSSFLDGEPRPPEGGILINEFLNLLQNRRLRRQAVLQSSVVLIILFHP